jgi:hypothetical protein
MYRNKKLLELANECDTCHSCGSYSRGTIVAAHSNQLRDGKGRGIKAADYRIAYLCFNCHQQLDQGKDLSREQRVDKWEEAHRKTIGWLFETGHLDVIK